jgi:hypothetical protein
MIKTVMKETLNVNETFKSSARRIEISEGLRRVRGHDPKLPVKGSHQSSLMVSGASSPKRLARTAAGSTWNSSGGSRSPNLGIEGVANGRSEVVAHSLRIDSRIGFGCRRTDASLVVEATICTDAVLKFLARSSNSFSFGDFRLFIH